MAIEMIPDVAAPLTVAVVNVASRTAMPRWHDWIVYGMTAGGYLAAAMRRGGDFAKNIGVSSLPLTVDKLYERVRGGTVTRRMSYNVAGRVRQTPGPGFQDLETY